MQHQLEHCDARSTVTGAYALALASSAALQVSCDAPAVSSAATTAALGWMASICFLSLVVLRLAIVSCGNRVGSWRVVAAGLVVLAVQVLQTAHGHEPLEAGLRRVPWTGTLVAVGKLLAWPGAA